ncbi:MmpS family transport accessory protein [Streptomyces sanyensis]|uniref:MmpS family transport accessory protein n=1 Tax=Streptomyces sanyensis TaxID=568869 RepID=UPI003D77AC31
MSEQPEPPQWGPPRQPAPQPRRRRRWPWVLLGVVVLLAGGCAAVVAVLVNEVSDEVDRPVTVVYEVTGDAEEVTVAYTVWNDGDLATEQRALDRLPWRREVEASGLGRNGTMTVTVGPNGGSATCRVTVDDGPERTATAEGAFTTATCQSR